MIGQPMIGQTLIRQARAADLEAVVEVFLACWTISYAPLLPAAAHAVMDRETATALWRAALADPTAFVAEHGGGAIGVARCTLVGRGTGRVDSLYVHPRTQGSGLGGRLLAACTDHLLAAGASRATLWVFAPNEPARAFYARHGWQPTGEQRVEPEYGVPEVELARVLT
ncbi:GNAT family N-acetyltransferase [Pseudonocardia aurantiaca]|uniref:GNAT family N-acetyltransferase n=1 Tax=Pseudonocardia aurantiaca TaxID=75290 RepID=A0ABW4FLM9_9PSEU